MSARMLTLVRDGLTLHDTARDAEEKDKKVPAFYSAE